MDKIYDKIGDEYYDNAPIVDTNEQTWEDYGD